MMMMMMLMKKLNNIHNQDISSLTSNNQLQQTAEIIINSLTQLGCDYIHDDNSLSNANLHVLEREHHDRGAIASLLKIK
jgi:hypothetical protein